MVTRSGRGAGVATRRPDERGGGGGLNSVSVCWAVPQVRRYRHRLEGADSRVPAVAAWHQEVQEGGLFPSRRKYPRQTETSWYETVALGRDPRAWAEAIASSERFAVEPAVARASRRRLCRRWWKVRPGKIKFYPGVIDSLI
ncbi:hypothetical protein RA210_U10479 [Rubrivivax sp. A210]|nr:hypothetical protein RA210_U10479 [Rubrivivax sp. A210]